MNVLVIPEDFRKDQFVLKPIVRAMLAALGKPNANVRVLTDPLLGGVSEALSWAILEPILDRYKGMITLFLLVVDRDGAKGRRAAISGLERKARAVLPPTRCFLGEHAIEEVEIWALAGQALPGAWRWSDLRAHTNPKEAYFEPWVDARALGEEPGQGRQTLGLEAAKAYPRVKSRCPDDVGRLEARIAEFLRHQ